MMPDQSILNTFITLGIAVALIGFALYLVRKYSQSSKILSGELEMRVISKLSLSPKNHIYAVKVADKTLLLGVSEKNINTLAELDVTQKLKPSDLKKFDESDFPSENPSDLSFKSFLKSAFKKN